MVYLQVHYRGVESSAKSSDEHTNALIDAKLSPEVRGINASNTRLSGNINNLATRIENLEKAVETLADNQSKEVQKIIKRLLDVARTSPPDTASKLMNTVASLVAATSSERAPATPDFFRDVSANLGEINKNGNADLKSISFSIQHKLAEYRSSLIPPPSVTAITLDCHSILGATGYAITNPNILGHTISDGVVANCFQPLDGIAWVNMTFVNSQILYLGGPVVLRNVQFINCTFQTYQTEAGFAFLQYAALDKTEFEYRKGRSNPPGL